MQFLHQVDKSWTLFLDRDGVINHEKHNDYIRNENEFIFYDDVLKALQKLSVIFGRIIIVTNQRGIGRGLMTTDDLTAIHDYMLKQIKASGGEITAIYYAPDMDKEAFDRKPNIGMGLKAQADYPTIDFNKSIMVGNNISDTQFGKSLGMHTVYVETTKLLDHPHETVDCKFDHLVAFTAYLEQLLSS